MRALIVFSHLRWHELLRAQQLLSRLGRHARVWFVETPIRTEGDPSIDRYGVEPNVVVLVPRVPLPAPSSGPDPGSPRDDVGVFDSKRIELLKPLLGDFFTSEGITRAALWFCTAQAWPLRDVVQADAIVYDRLADAAALADDTDLFDAADLVFVPGPSLCDARRGEHANVVCLPDAVDPARLAPKQAVRDTEAVRRVHAVQSRISHPRLGFFGRTDAQVDLTLLAALADAQPGWQIVMAGEVDPSLDPAALPQRANLHWLGAQPTDLQPQFLASWDVCLLPLVVGKATRFANPPQTLACMAAEKPVVSTAVPDVKALYGDVACIAEDTAQFIAQCHQQLHESMFKRVARITRMTSMVSRSSWDAVAGMARRALEDTLLRREQRARHEQARRRREALAALSLPTSAVTVAPEPPALSPTRRSEADATPEHLDSGVVAQAARSLASLAKPQAAL